MKNEAARTDCAKQFSIRALVVAAPASVALLVALTTFRLSALMPVTRSEFVATPIALVAAVGALAAVDHTVRRALPLPWLNDLATLFPDRSTRLLRRELRNTSMPRLERSRRSQDPQEARAATTVLQLVRDMTTHDRLTRGHCERVRALSMMLADQMRITGLARDRLEWAALLHDVGKVDVPHNILNKPGPLATNEWRTLRKHPNQGALITSEVHEWLGESAHAIDQHHERYDGQGYPSGLQRDQIALPARIVAVADAFEVMTANRTYNKAVHFAEARRELIACSGSHFDPVVVRAFVALSVPRIPVAIALLIWPVAVSI